MLLLCAFAPLWFTAHLHAQTGRAASQPERQTAPVQQQQPKAPPQAQPASTNAPIIDAISPDSVIEKPVPQPTIIITGSNFLVGFPSPTNLPTITLAHQDSDFEFSKKPNNIDFNGTTLTLLPGNNDFNLLQAPLGSYDVTVTRPDGQSATVVGAFSINTQPEPAPGEITMRVASYWGGPIMGMDLSPDGNLAYIANGRVLRILDISDESNPTSIGSIYLGGVYDVKVKGDYAFVAAQGPYSFCVVDGLDLLILLSAWGECTDPNDCPADINDDGSVDGLDLLILLSNWG